MTSYTPEVKQLILSQYSSSDATRSFRALSHQYGMEPSGGTISRWYSDWDGTIESLQHKQGAGRPRILTRSEVTKYIQQPVAKANRSNTAIDYNEIHTRVEEKTGQELSLRTVQRYGKEDAGIKSQSTHAVTVDERQYTTPYSICLDHVSVCVLSTKWCRCLFV